MAKVNETDQHDAQQVADKALADCGGNGAAARLLLAHQLIVAARSISRGFPRFGPAGRR
ncbi:hypothetical protein [Azospirillum baldaniorum]|uniref:hypothetical protein n=1 Tax=Azospirillum baldaniorum TaxID=1064539 RepID=UPI00157B771C|nr:hypothetical protein [Azospirillum baldaniorum]